MYPSPYPVLEYIHTNANPSTSTIHHTNRGISCIYIYIPPTHTNLSNPTHSHYHTKQNKTKKKQELAFLIVGLCVLLLLVALLGRYTRHYRAKLLAEAEVQVCVCMYICMCVCVIGTCV